MLKGQPLLPASSATCQATSATCQQYYLPSNKCYLPAVLPAKQPVPPASAAACKPTSAPCQQCCLQNDQCSLPVVVPTTKGLHHSVQRDSLQSLGMPSLRQVPQHWQLPLQRKQVLQISALLEPTRAPRRAASDAAAAAEAAATAGRAEDVLHPLAWPAQCLAPVTQQRCGPACRLRNWPPW